MSSKRIEIFKKFSENIFKMSRILKEKASHSQKSLLAITALPQWPVRPYECVSRCRKNLKKKFR
jgi:hypothetical protein